MKLMYITSDVRAATAAQGAGVDWIFVDLEINGKEKRQGHLDTVISGHTISDVSAIRSVLESSLLLVRVNPLNLVSKSEIDEVIAAGADIVMLPFFTSKQEVEDFISIVNGRAQTCLLVETPAAAESLDEIADLPGIDFVHIGLNDLHLGYNLSFMFEPLTNGTVDKLASTLKKSGIEFGFGGIARLGEGALPAERILAEHRRVGSSIVILSRSFLNVGSRSSHLDLRNEFLSEVARVREYEEFLEIQQGEFFSENQAETCRLVDEIVQKIRG